MKKRILPEDRLNAINEYKKIRDNNCLNNYSIAGMYYLYSFSKKLKNTRI